jgi:predicted O-methyltransferase YrrM
MSPGLKEQMRKMMPGSLFSLWRAAYWRFRRAQKKGRYARTRLHALMAYPANTVKRAAVRKRFLPKVTEHRGGCRRVFAYNYGLLPNAYLARVEKEIASDEAAIEKSGLTIGYPGWNLLYYSLICSLPRNTEETVIVETGTSIGLSTVILAQALKDTGARGVIYTVDINKESVERARRTIEDAGVSAYVRLHAEDSIAFLASLVKSVPCIHFALLDGNHEYAYVKKEFSIIYPRVVACGGKVYFDNTVCDIDRSIEVARALHFIRHAYSGHMIEFRNCSAYPPGDALWQSAW